jgi:hypothetical protein
MPFHGMRFVVVNDMSPRRPSVCTQCSRTLERGYLHDLATSMRYCGVDCYPQRLALSVVVGSIVPATPFEFAVAWPRLTVDIASALFDIAWSDPSD